MPDQIYIGNFPKGLNTRELAFNLDNGSFPNLFNFYIWRGRAKRKRGTAFLGQLQRQLSIAAIPTNFQQPQFALVAGAGNFITALGLESTSTIAPGTINITVAGNIYTEPPIPDGTLLKNGLADPGSTINYATGAFIIAGGGVNFVTGTLSYFPGLPVMGLADFVPGTAATLFPLLLAFDTKYSYQVNQVTSTPFFYNTTYYKGTQTPFVWTGTDAQLFWTTNYSGALWATNSKPGFHFVNATVIAGSGTADITFHFESGGNPFTTLVVGDKLFFNEFTTASFLITGVPTVTPNVILNAVNTLVAGQQIKISGVEGMTQLNQGTFTVVAASGTQVTINVDGKDFDDYSSGGEITLVENESINGETGTVTTILGGGNYIVHFTEELTAVGPGIAQLLTNSISGQDGIRWYDGDPTSGTGIPTGTGLGWVNFAPPLTNLTVSIDNKVSDKYYLVGALMILPFKDRLLFFSPTIQSSLGAPILLQDTVLWSWNGTPYYAAPVPIEQTFDVSAYFVDQTGKGGYLPAGISQPIITAGANEDAILVGFGGRGRKTRFAYTGNDLQPFLFYNINNEYPSSSTFSSVVFDRGMMDIGTKGITVTDQQSCQRIDVEIPDNVFQIKASDSGFLRVNALRDDNNEWVYFSYPLNDSRWKFPVQTFLYNYRDNTWAIFYENYTAHGYFRPQKKNTWATISTTFGSWNAWRVPWNSGLTSVDIPKTIAGNPQGYVLYIGEGTGESRSGTILAISNASGSTQITSINHCVTEANSSTGNGDFLLIQGALGTTSINGLIGEVIKVIDADNFVIDLPFPAGVYGGLGTFTRLSQPILQTKQFNPYWEQGRQTRLSTQKYLMEYTANGQVTVNIFLSQNPDESWNSPLVNPPPNSLVYSQLMYTCPESTNLGLTPANTNLQMPTAQGQYQIWHRFNTSMIGDSVQIGITLSDDQMKNLEFATSEIVLSGIHLSVSPSSMLA